MFDQLNPDILTTICSLVELGDLPSLCSANSKLSQICSTETCYMHRVKREHPTFTKSPKLTFEKFYKMLKRFESNTAQMFEIPEDMFSWDKTEDQHLDDYEDIDKLNKELLPKVLTTFPIRRGDLIHLESEGEYRNDGKFIFDGASLMSLAFEPDDYGTLPKEFKILDDELTFSPIHWMDVIDHNGYVHFDSGPYMDQLEKNLIQTETTITKIGKKTYEEQIWKTFFVHSTGARFTIRFQFDLGLSSDRENVIKFLKKGLFYIGGEDLESTPFNMHLYIYDCDFE